MPALTGKSVLERKKCLANLVVKRLVELGHKAQVVENRTNDAGHTDRVLVESSLGLVHITALSSTNPNDAIPYQAEEQKWIAGKSYSAIGWNTKDHRTLIFFVSANLMEGRTDLTKDSVRSLSSKELSFVLGPIA